MIGSQDWLQPWHWFHCQKVGQLFKDKNALDRSAAVVATECDIILLLLLYSISLELCIIFFFFGNSYISCLTWKCQNKKNLSIDNILNTCRLALGLSHHNCISVPMKLLVLRWNTVLDPTTWMWNSLYTFCVNKTMLAAGVWERGAEKNIWA